MQFQSANIIKKYNFSKRVFAKIIPSLIAKGLPKIKSYVPIKKLISKFSFQQFRYKF